jgi:COP9 signalosome complex subunit 2
MTAPKQPHQPPPTSNPQPPTRRRRTILEDPFIRDYVEDLLKKIRTQVLLKLIQPSTRVRIPFISAKLNVPEKDVEALLVTLILDGRVAGYIDQVHGLLEVGDKAAGSAQYAALDKWNAQLKAIHTAVLNRM